MTERASGLEIDLAIILTYHGRAPRGGGKLKLSKLNSELQSHRGGKTIFRRVLFFSAAPRHL